MPTLSPSGENLDKFNASGTPIVEGDTVLIKNRAGTHMIDGRGVPYTPKVEAIDANGRLKIRYRRMDGGPLETFWVSPDGVDRVGDQNNSNDCVWTGEHTNCRHTAVMPAGRLAAITTRDEAHSYLAGAGLTKPQLLELARTLQVDVGSRDSMKTIRRRIVDATAGVREDAEAIRATDLSRQSVPTGVPTLPDPDADPPAEDSKLGAPPQRWPHGDSGIVPEHAWDGDPLYRDQQTIPSGLDSRCTFPGCNGRQRPVPGTDSWDADGTAMIDTRCDGTHPDGRPCTRESAASWYWPEDQAPAEDRGWNSQNETTPQIPVEPYHRAAVLKPMLARNRYTDEEWEVASKGRCGWAVDYRGSGTVFCNEPSDPRSEYRYCQEHDDALIDDEPLPENMATICPRCGYCSNPGEPIGTDHCHFTACGVCGEVGGPDKMQFSHCRRCGSNGEHLYDIPETAIPTWRRQIYDAKDAFQYTDCEYCGKDLNRHVAYPDPLGNVSLVCLDEPDPDGHSVDQVVPPAPAPGTATPRTAPATFPRVEVDSPETLAAAVNAIRDRAFENREAAVDYAERTRDDSHALDTLISSMIRHSFSAEDLAVANTLRDPSRALQDASNAAAAAASALHANATTASKMATQHITMKARGAAGAFYR